MILTKIGDAELDRLNETLEQLEPQEILRWAAERFGDGLTLACSFGGVSGMVLLDMAAKVAPGVSVFYVDTGFLFRETHDAVAAARRRYGVVPLAYRPKRTPEEQAARHGDRLWERDPDRCCALRKVEPTAEALAGKAAWVAGLRRDQSGTRRDVRPIQWDAKFGLYKVCPLWDWDEEKVWYYIALKGVPVNALHAHGYASIGCTHCTRPVGKDEDLRAGRWSGREKTECGLHL